MSINSNKKGKVGELELCKELEKLGITDARRTQQYAGKPGEDSGDIISKSLSKFNCEVKRVERLNIDTAMSQSRSDSNEDQKPLVFHRRNRKPWLVTMDLETFVELFKSQEPKDE